MVEHSDANNRDVSENTQHPVGDEQLGSSAAKQSPATIASVGVVGAGVMGRAIAIANAGQGFPVTLTDRNAETLSTGMIALQQEIAQQSLDGVAAPTRSIRKVFPIRATLADEEVANADLVIETIAEKRSAKRQVLGRLERLMRPQALLASNTSSIPISRLATVLSHPGRFCGLHFCHPVHRRPVVEVVRGQQTTERTIERAADYVRSLDKLPIVVNDGPGFLVNRLLSPYMNEALELILEGAPVDLVEGAATAFGMPLGPLRQFDAFGLDVAVRSGAILYAAFPERLVVSNLPIALYQLGRLGEKTQAGFFTYADDEVDATFDSTVQRLIDEHRKDSRVFSAEEVTWRLFLPMLLEASRALEEKIAESPDDVDTALRGGLGFAPPAGGLLRWADAVGIAEILKQLSPFRSLGKRYEPTQQLQRLAGDGCGFYDSHEDHRDRLERNSRAA